MLYRHVFDNIFTKFRSIFRVFVNFVDLPNFAAPRQRKISEALAEEVLVAKGEKTWSQMRPIQLQCQALLYWLLV